MHGRKCPRDKHENGAVVEARHDAPSSAIGGDHVIDAAHGEEHDDREEAADVAGERDVAEAERRHHDERPVDARQPGVFSPLGVLHDHVEQDGVHEHERRQPDENEWAEPHEVVAQCDDDARRQRQLRSQSGEQVGECRDDLPQNDADDRAGNDHHRDGINHRRLDLRLQLDRLLDVLREALQDDVEDTAGFADGEHVDEEIVEGSRILAIGLRQRGTALDIGRDAGGHVAEHLRLALLGQDLQRLRDRQAGVHHGGELTGVDGEVLVLDLAAEPFRRGGGARLHLLFLDRRGDDAPGAQRHHGGRSGVGLDLAAHGAGARPTPVREDRHRASPYPRVTRSTSSIVVVPSSTFMSPA